MGGTRDGGLIAKETNLSRDPDFYKKLGAMGGRASRGGGFAKMDRARLIEVSRKGGKKSRRKKAVDNQLHKNNHSSNIKE